MANTIPRKPAENLALLNQMIHGLEMHGDELNLDAQALLEQLIPVRDALQAAIHKRVQTAGAAERATQELQATGKVAYELAKNVRFTLYGMIGKTDSRLLAFGLDTLKNRWQQRKK